MSIKIVRACARCLLAHGNIFELTWWLSSVFVVQNETEINDGKISSSGVNLQETPMVSEGSALACCTFQVCVRVCVCAGVRVCVCACVLACVDI